MVAASIPMVLAIITGFVMNYLLFENKDPFLYSIIFFVLSLSIFVFDDFTYKAVAFVLTFVSLVLLVLSYSGKEQATILRKVRSY